MHPRMRSDLGPDCQICTLKIADYLLSLIKCFEVNRSGSKSKKQNQA